MPTTDQFMLVGSPTHNIRVEAMAANQFAGISWVKEKWQILKLCNEAREFPFCAPTDYDWVTTPDEEVLTENDPDEVGTCVYGEWRTLLLGDSTIFLLRVGYYVLITKRAAADQDRQAASLRGCHVIRILPLSALAGSILGN
jgi:hypothetical protein